MTIVSKVGGAEKKSWKVWERSLILVSNSMLQLLSRQVTGKQTCFLQWILHQIMSLQWKSCDLNYFLANTTENVWCWINQRCWKKQEGNICFPEVWRYCNTIIVYISYIVYIVKYLFSRGISISCEVVRSDGGWSNINVLITESDLRTHEINLSDKIGEQPNLMKSTPQGGLFLKYTLPTHCHLLCDPNNDPPYQYVGSLRV